MSCRLRTDAFTFYSVGVVSFLESTVATYVENLIPFFPDNPAVRDWLQRVWLPEEAEHGRLTRRYVERVWPEFEWDNAYALFLQSYKPRCDHRLLRRSPALEALARCVTEAETAMMYRCFGAYASDPELQSLMRRMSTDEARHFAYFRKVFNHYDRTERQPIWRTAMIVVGRSKLVRDEDLPIAFAHLNTCWRRRRPFDSMSYEEFLFAACLMMRRYFPFEDATRMLFRPLRKGRPLEKLLIRVLALVLRRQYLCLARPNITFDRTAGSHSLAAAGQRARSATRGA